MPSFWRPVAVLLLFGCAQTMAGGSAQAVELALAHVQLDRESVEVDVVDATGGSWDVVLVRDVADQDDSVRAVRHIVTVSEVNDELRVVDTRVEQACQPGRGHADFSEIPCS